MSNLAWRHYAFGTAGQARGYLASGYYLYHTLRRLLGPDLVDAWDVGAHPKVHLHFAPPHIFAPIPGKVNVLFSMWEGDVLPDYVVHALRMADVLIVPSDYCAEVWRRHGLMAYVAPLGVPDAFIACDEGRSVIEGHERPLRFLSVGSITSRKGWTLLAAAWERAFLIRPKGVPLPRTQLIAKTIGDGTTQAHFGGRVVIDQRDLEPAQMLDLYRSSDVVVSASYGEGFGLTVLEGMACGCLAVSTDAGGLAAFVTPETSVVVPRTERATIDYGVPFGALIARPEELARAMAQAWEGWGTPAMEARRRRGVEVARSFTWVQAGQRLLLALVEHGCMRPPGGLYASTEGAAEAEGQGLDVSRSSLYTGV